MTLALCLHHEGAKTAKCCATHFTR